MLSKGRIAAGVVLPRQLVRPDLALTQGINAQLPAVPQKAPAVREESSEEPLGRITPRGTVEASSQHRRQKITSEPPARVGMAGVP